MSFYLLNSPQNYYKKMKYASFLAKNLCIPNICSTFAAAKAGLGPEQGILSE
jgi:hypothetical protein